MLLPSRSCCSKKCQSSDPFGDRNRLYICTRVYLATKIMGLDSSVDVIPAHPENQWNLQLLSLQDSLLVGLVAQTMADLVSPPRCVVWANYMFVCERLSSA
jgi:hypothetical protein